MVRKKSFCLPQSIKSWISHSRQTNLITTLLIVLCGISLSETKAQAKVISVIPVDGYQFQLPGNSWEILKSDMVLLPGTRVQSIMTSAKIELQCIVDSSTAFYIDSGFFAISPPTAPKKCVIDLESGKADVVTDGKSEVTTDIGTIESRGTQYSVHRVNNREQESLNVLVYDGDVIVKKNGERTRVRSGSKLTLAPNFLQELELSSGDYNKAARLYATMDYYKAQRAGDVTSEDTYSTLEQLHFDSLRDPGNADHRVELAKYQGDIGLVSKAKYNLKRVKVNSSREYERYEIDTTKIPRGRKQRGN